MNITKFNQFISQLGYQLPNDFNYNIGINQIVRFKDVNKLKDNKNLWLHRVSLNSYVFGDWSRNEKHIYNDNREYTKQEYKHYYKAKQKQEYLEYKEHRAIANACVNEYNKLADVDPQHPYLVKKQVLPCFGMKQKGNAIVVPIFGTIAPFEGDLQSLQYILPDGFKQFRKGAKYKGGCFNVNDNGTDYFIYAEGLATSLSILRYVQKRLIRATIICCFTCGNLEPVISYMRRIYPKAYFEIWADKDKSRVGQETAIKIAERFDNIKVRLPDLTPEQVEQGYSDFNDWFNLHGVFNNEK